MHQHRPERPCHLKPHRTHARADSGCLPELFGKMTPVTGVEVVQDPDKFILASCFQFSGAALEAGASVDRKVTAAPRGWEASSHACGCITGTEAASAVAASATVKCTQPARAQRASGRWSLRTLSRRVFRRLDPDAASAVLLGRLMARARQQ